MEQMELTLSAIMPEPIIPRVKRERRPKWMLEQAREDKRIRQERRERKRSEREQRKQAREEKRKRREGLDQVRAECEATFRALRPLGRIMFCESCNTPKVESHMFSEDKCLTCEYKEITE